MTETQQQHPITVLGAGSWGTALAIQLARAAQPTVLWGRAEDQPELLAVERCNRRYLPDAPFPDDLAIEPDLEKAVRSSDDILVCVPSVAFRQVLTDVNPYLTESSRIAWATKGFEQRTGKLPHEVARDVLGDKLPLAVLSGPTFAREVGAGLPTAMTIAATDAEFGNALAEPTHTTISSVLKWVAR